MSQPDIEDHPDLNTGKPWSEMDLFDLANCVRLKQPVEEIAGYLWAFWLSRHLSFVGGKGGFFCVGAIGVRASS
jgi:hypothetical protein